MRPWLVLLFASACGSASGLDSGLVNVPDSGVSAIDAGASDSGTPDAGASDAGHPSSDMVPVAAGPFLRGCSSCDADEAPVQVVTLSAFQIDRTEVTQRAYGSCVDAGRCTAPSANFDPSTTPLFPVVNVTWAQAVSFCTSLGKRLPTEAEWEKAARGTDGGTFPWGNAAASCTLANTSACGGVVQAVGSLPAGASPYGALDLAGNVWEWTQDWYDAQAYATGGTVDPQGPSSGTIRVYRGGSASNDASLARASNRASTYSPTVGGSGLGFRCAR